MDERLDALLHDPSFALALLDGAPMVVVVLDQAQRLLHCNPFAERLLKRPIAEVRGCDWVAEFIPSGEQDRVAGLLGELFAGTTVPINVNPVRVPGGTRLIEWHDQMVEIEGETLLIGMGLDISERVREASERATLAQRFELFAREVDEAFFLLSQTRDRLLYISPSIEGVLGVSRDALYRDVGVFADVLHPDDRASFLASVGQPLEPGVRVEREYRILRPRAEGGEPELRWLWIRYSAVEGLGGISTQLAGVVSDVTEHKRAALEHEELGQLFELLDHAIDEVFLLIDPARERVLYVSESVERVFGFDREAVKTDFRARLSLVHPEDREALGALLGLGPGEQGSLEYRIRLPDGRDRWLLTRARVLDDSSALPGALVAITIDVTEQRRVEARLRELTTELEARVEERTASLAQEREHLRRVLDSMAAYVLLLGVEGEILLVNRSVREDFGVEDAGLPRKASELFEGMFLEAPCKSASMAAFTQAKGGERARFDHSLLLRSGEELILDVTLEPIVDAQGQVTEIVTSAIDVSAARTTAQRLRASLASLAVKESRLADAQRIAEVGDWDWDIVTNQLKWSDECCRIIGVEPGSVEPSYEDFLALVHEDDRKPVDDAVRGALEGEPYAIEHRLIRPSGELRYIFEQGQVTRDADGKPVRMQGTAQDITRQKLVEARLRASLAEKDALLNEIHHRVKNNLQVVVSLLYLQGLGLDETSRAALDDTRGRIRSMVLIHEQLYLSGQLSSIDMHAFLTRLIEEVARVFKGRQTPQIRVERLGEADLVLGIESAVPVGLIANELLTNALKHAYPESEAEPSTQAPEVRIEIGARGLVVEDDGVGLPAGFNTSSASSLGLRLVRTLSRQLGAKLSYGQSESGGMRVELMLPSRD